MRAACWASLLHYWRHFEFLEEQMMVVMLIGQFRQREVAWVQFWLISFPLISTAGSTQAPSAQGGKAKDGMKRRRLVCRGGNGKRLMTRVQAVQGHACRFERDSFKAVETAGRVCSAAPFWRSSSAPLGWVRAQRHPRVAASKARIHPVL